MSRLPQESGGGSIPFPSVSTELEQIFVGATGLPSSRSARRPSGRDLRSPSARGGRRRRAPTAALGAAAAMILAGASAFAVAYSAPSSSANPKAAAPSATAHNASPIVTAPMPSGLAAADAPIHSAPVRSERAPRAHRVEIAAAAPRRISRPAPVRRLAYGDLIAADQQLRRAYAGAISAGVPRSILVDYRDRWDDLRQETNWRPDRVVVGYRALAGDLTRLSRPTSGYERREAFREPGGW
jgi:hypothetical protein